ncbi:hypothetical protein CMEL01_11142 [Colletotrichum melonis]|uniref:Uncharacterized protein n=1 Tax=Colletotrichum melonis TaxID=1209925 RepID=A0AAI9XZZ9_9PEZI|nr:hypothetical protein CMEL01_11142 [Colletotrichum melonis]
MKATETAMTDKPQCRAAQIPTVVATAMCKRAHHRVMRDVPSGSRRFGNIICKEVANFFPHWAAASEPQKNMLTLCKASVRIQDTLETGECSRVGRLELYPRTAQPIGREWEFPHSASSWGKVWWDRWLPTAEAWRPPSAQAHKVELSTWRFSRLSSIYGFSLRPASALPNPVGWRRLVQHGLRSSLGHGTVKMSVIPARVDATTGENED